MIIKNVQIENFFCYVGIENFEFEEGLNIVSAKNSGGKSHLFNAFHWTFFNSIYVDKEEDTSRKEWKSADKVLTLPDFVIANAKEDETLKTTIKIVLSTEFHLNEEIKGEFIDYHFEKEVKFKKSNQEIIQISKPELQIWYVMDGETIYLERGEQRWFLDLIFPVSIRKFMWFQGETVDELYDFSNPSTLNYAIKEISYFPIYENLVEITKSSASSIEKKIDNELKKKKKFTSEQENLTKEIDYLKTKISNYDNNIIDCRNEIINLSEAILKEEDKLKGYDKYSSLKTQLNKLEYEIKTVNDKIDQLSVFGKEKFISKWMLNKCDSLVKASASNLDLLSKEIKTFQKSENPVPITLPGPEYVQKMLDDHICYICEREVSDGSPAYGALQSRMEDFRANQIQKILSDNFTELNRFKRNLLNELPSISEEVNENDAQIEKLINQRKKLLSQRENLYSDFGVSDDVEINSGYSTADQILSKIRSLNSSKSSTDRKLLSYENDKKNEELHLNELLEKKAKIIPTEDSDEIPEIQAKKYIEVINEAVNHLKRIALDQLIREITEESNILYSKYLGGKTQGEIEIDRGVRIIDKTTKKQLTNLNTAELTAQKLAVANSFLSLSEKKMNRSFPLLADAPTSQFDDENTLFLTENLSESFNQIIIMSKDYNKLSNEEKQKFILKANISKYYELRNDLIDVGGENSRTNKKTYINILK
jgi:predicted  nucleic acid-binding Zn-ribbon protein